MKRKLPSPELMRKLLRYEPHTGKLFWRERTPDMFAAKKQTAEHNCSIWNGRHAGKEAFTSTNSYGYKRSCVLGFVYHASRVIWAIQTGAWPKNEIDHVNTDPGDNRWRNLREATRSQNNQNTKRRKSNKSGIKGVSWARQNKKWHAQISVNKTKYSLGFYDNIMCARKAYIEAVKKHHGNFANTGG